MVSRRRTILNAALTATADTRSRGPSYSPDLLMRFWRQCVRWSALSRQRRALSYLDDHLLADVGLTRQQAEAEAAKPPWE
jgi:uncharacterized protein YjiS (DUF1127 family)